MGVFKRKRRTEFTIKLAGIPIAVNAAFYSTKLFCRKYLTEEAPLFAVTVTKEHIEKMRRQERMVALAEGRAPANSERYLETLALACAVLEKLIQYNVLMFHGSVLAVNGKAYMFTARSGTGKTTHSRLWLKKHPESHILNGDKPLLLFRDGMVFACGSPWMGKERYGANEILPLEAICLLERDETNHIEEIALKDGLGLLMNQCYIPDGRGNIVTAAGFIQKLSDIKFYRLGCNMKEDAAIVSYGAMVK